MANCHTLSGLISTIPSIIWNSLSLEGQKLKMGLPRLNQGVGRTPFLSGSSKEMHFLSSVPFSTFQASTGRSNSRCSAIFHILTLLLSLLHLMTRMIPSGSDGKESACNAGDSGLDPWVRKIPWRRAWQPTPVFFPGEYHGQNSLVDYSPCVTKSRYDWSNWAPTGTYTGMWFHWDHLHDPGPSPYLKVSW